MTAINVGRNISLGSLPDTVNQDAAAATFDILTRFFRQGIRTAFGLGLVMVLGAWLAGPGQVPAKIRGLVTSRNHTADTEPSAGCDLGRRSLRRPEGRHRRRRRRARRLGRAPEPRHRVRRRSPARGGFATVSLTAARR